MFHNLNSEVDSNEYTAYRCITFVGRVIGWRGKPSNKRLCYK